MPGIVVYVKDILTVVPLCSLESEPLRRYPHSHHSQQTRKRKQSIHSTTTSISCDFKSIHERKARFPSSRRVEKP